MVLPNGFWRGVVKPELEGKAGRQLLAHALVKRKHIRPISTQAGGNEVTDHAYKSGKRLRQIAHGLAVTHAPRNSAGVALCWGYNSHNGCRLSADDRTRAHGKMKQKGIHRAAQSQLIRRAGAAEGLKPKRPMGPSNPFGVQMLKPRKGNRRIARSRDWWAGI